MVKRQVYTLGETVFDIIFSNEVPVSARPGGAMLNTAVSLGRMAVPVSFISDFGEDQPGRIIASFLENNDVSTRYIHRYNDGKTALALAFLDEKMDADYSFYKIFPTQRLGAQLPETGPDDILLFGSFYAITAELRDTISAFVRRARQAGTLIIYDPNFRKAHLPELDRVLPWILENIAQADIVRGSDEDFAHIFGTPDPASACRSVQNAGCTKLILTRNKEGVILFTGTLRLEIPVPQIQPVSTIGAGDAFNAGIIWSLMHRNTTPALLDHLEEEMWREMINTGILFSAAVCRQLDNYLPAGFTLPVNDGQAAR